MATDDYGQGISVADRDSPADAEVLAKNIANGLAQRSVLRYDSATARSAALTGATAPVEGMVTWLRDVNKLFIYDGSSWVEMQPALKTQFVDDPTTKTTTSTGYTNTGNLTLTITGPPSGQVEVTIGVRCDNTTGQNTLSSFDASGSSSGPIYTAHDEAATQWANTVSAGPFTVTQVIGCTPGETVTVTMKHRVVGGTGNFRYRSIKLRQL